MWKHEIEYFLQATIEKLKTVHPRKRNKLYDILYPLGFDAQARGVMYSGMSDQSVKGMLLEVSSVLSRILRLTRESHEISLGSAAAHLFDYEGRPWGCPSCIYGDIDEITSESLRDAMIDKGEWLKLPYKTTLLTFWRDKSHFIHKSGVLLSMDSSDDITVIPFSLKDGCMDFEFCWYIKMKSDNSWYDGHLLSNSVFTPEKNMRTPREPWHPYWVWYLLNVSHGLRLLTCKNVTLSPVNPPKKENTKRRRQGKLPLYRYHVLTLDLDKGRRLAGQSPKRGLGTAPVHLCRGHFKEYTEDRPLFGRVTGRFWWQPFARGKAGNGVVMKDYMIKQPREAVAYYA